MPISLLITQPHCVRWLVSLSSGMARPNSRLSSTSSMHFPGRIPKGVINRAEVIERDAGPADQVVFGRHVVLCDLDTDKEVTYQLVGAYESDPCGGKISIESPLGRELIGKALGDEVRVKTPRGLLEYEIVEVY